MGQRQSTFLVVEPQDTQTKDNKAVYKMIGSVDAYTFQEAMGKFPELKDGDLLIGRVKVKKKFGSYLVELRKAQEDMIVIELNFTLGSTHSLIADHEDLPTNIIKG